MLVLPFYKDVTIELNNMLKKLDVLPVNNLNIKFENLIRLGKDECKTDDISNIVYKIDCNDCDCTSIGQSKRKLFLEDI